MNVLFLSFWYPTKENPLKGIFVKEHAKSISKTGADITVLAFDVVYSKSFFKLDYEVIMDEDSIETHYIHVHSRFYKWVYSIPYLTSYIAGKYISKNIQTKKKIELIHSNVLFPAACVGYLLSKRLNTKHIITEHWSKVDRFTQKHLFGYLGKNALKNARAITTVSEYLKGIVVSISPESTSKITVVPNVIDESVFYYTMKGTHSELVFTAIATWSSPKNPGLLVDALERVQLTAGKPIVLNFVGNGPLLDSIKERNHSFQINYLGTKKHEEINEILQKSDFFLHASSIETFSIVIAEALMTGTPVIASNAGAIPELINPENGLLAENSIESWVENITKALFIAYNHEKISTENSEKFNSDRIGYLFMKLYGEI